MSFLVVSQRAVNTLRLRVMERRQTLQALRVRETAASRRHVRHGHLTREARRWSLRRVGLRGSTATATATAPVASAIVCAIRMAVRVLWMMLLRLIVLLDAALVRVMVRRTLIIHGSMHG